MRLILALTLLLSILSGCGFHLRGAHPPYAPYTLPFSEIILSPDDPFNPVYKQLRHRLQAQKVKVISRACANSPEADNIPSLVITAQKLTEQPFAYGPNGETRREKLLFEIHYVYQYKTYEKIGKATTRRFRQLNLDQNLADRAEKALLEREMIVDVVQQCLLQLTSQ